MDDHEVAPAARGLARRCATAAIVGGGLGLAWLAVMNTASLDAAVSGAELGGLVILYLGLPTGAVLAWPLLWAARVRRAWLVALLAPAPVVAMWFLLDAVRIDAWLLLGLTSGGYAAAALVTAPGIRLRWWRPAAAAVMAAMVVLGAGLSGPLRSWQANSHLEDELRAFGHPLYAPDLPGFRVVNAGASATLGADLTFYYELQPTNTSAEILVQQSPMPAAFTPPTDCRAALTFHVDSPVPCTLVAPEVWALPAYHMEATRRGDQIIRLTATGDLDLDKAVTTLREQPPSHFTGAQA